MLALPDDEPQGAALHISVEVRHRVKTVHVRQPMAGLVRSGTKSLVDSHGEHRHRAGEVFLVSGGTQWDVINDPAPGGRYVVEVLSFSNGLLQTFHAHHPQAEAAQVVQGQRGLTCDPELDEAMRRAAMSLRSPESSRALQQHRLMEVLLLLAERGAVFPAAAQPWDERVRRLIGHRLHVRWTVAEMAASFHTSASTLRRRMADHGVTLGEVVREVRMEAALAMLQSTGLGVGEIAARCGYESHSSFSAAFRQRFGFAPSHLRPAPGQAVNSSEQALALEN